VRVPTYCIAITRSAVTPALRGRIKVAAFRTGVTVAELVRGLLEERFPDTEKDV